MTYAAIQRWAGVKDDGILGPGIRRAVQEKLGVTADGVWGKLTISELQRQLNEGKI
jgi:murein L,D-transpeptidase YcbB/YkuD